MRNLWWYFFLVEFWFFDLSKKDKKIRKRYPQAEEISIAIVKRKTINNLNRNYEEK